MASDPDGKSLRRLMKVQQQRLTRDFFDDEQRNVNVRLAIAGQKVATSGGSRDDRLKKLGACFIAYAGTRAYDLDRHPAVRGVRERVELYRSSAIPDTAEAIAALLSYIILPEINKGLDEPLFWEWFQDNFTTCFPRSD